MSNIHGLSHKAIKHFRKYPAALAVYWIYVSRANNEGVAWPSVRGLRSDTGWSTDPTMEARAWLIEHEALEVVKDYVRPKWRKLEPAVKARLLNLDKAEYYRPTGKIVIDSHEFGMLYYGGNETSELEDTGEEVVPDVPPRRTSTAPNIDRAEHPRAGTKLGISITKLDSKKTKDDTKQSKGESKTLSATSADGQPSTSEAAKLKSLSRFTRTPQPPAPQQPTKSKKEIKVQPVVVRESFDMNVLKDVVANQGFKFKKPKQLESKSNQPDVKRIAQIIEVIQDALPDSTDCERARLTVDFYTFWSKKPINTPLNAGPFGSNFRTWLDTLPTYQLSAISKQQAWAGQDEDEPEDDPVAELKARQERLRPEQSLLSAPDVPAEIAKNWEVAHQQLGLQLDPSSFHTWVEGAQLTVVNGTTWEFLVKTEYQAQMCQHRINREISRVIRDVTGIKEVQLQFHAAAAVA